MTFYFPQFYRRTLLYSCFHDALKHAIRGWENFPHGKLTTLRKLSPSLFSSFSYFTQNRHVDALHTRTGTLESFGNKQFVDR